MGDSYSLLVGMGIGLVIGLLLGKDNKATTPTNDDPTGELKQKIFDTLTSVKEDISKTV